MFKAEVRDDFGLITVNSSLIYSIIDVLLGGRRALTRSVRGPALHHDDQPGQTHDRGRAGGRRTGLQALSPVRFNIDRLETDPRFAAISRPANAAILVRLRIDMEDRGGDVELLLPYATIEPISDVLLQMFMGETPAATKSGKGIWQPRSARRKWKSTPCFKRRSCR